jgi:catechol 2,3-dioxygenase-like lactoylglutathione lyase family enzyme
MAETKQGAAMRSDDFLTAVGIGVSDLARSEAFYRDVLGMKRTGTFHLDYMDEVMLAHEGRSAVVLMHYTDGSARNYRDNPVKLVFYVTDPVALAGKIKADGLEITHEPTPNAGLGGAVICLAKDPDGYLIELIQRPAASAASVTSAQTAVG